jgi:hypothetical protein
MRISFALSAAIFLASHGIGGLPSSGFGQTEVGATPRVATAPAVPVAGAASSIAAPAQPLKFKFLLFWKENSANVQQITETLKAASVRRPGHMEWSSVNVADAANQLLVERYQVSRAPMPLVLCVASNGAITGAYVRQFNEAAVERAIVTPAMADVTKALQDKKIVLLHIKPNAQSPLPFGAAEFAADPSFQARTTIVNLLATDPAETRFLTDMKVTAEDVRDPMLVVMAPPAVLVGKFAATTTKDQIAAQLHAAGKCCDDPNCTHNKGAQQ